MKRKAIAALGLLAGCLAVACAVSGVITGAAPLDTDGGLSGDLDAPEPVTGGVIGGGGDGSGGAGPMSGSGGASATGGRPGTGGAMTGTGGRGTGGAMMGTGGGMATGGRPGTGGAPATGGNSGGGAVFFDDFNGTTLSNQWIAMNRHGDYSSNSLECYTPANAVVNNGFLEITAKLETRTCGDWNHTPAQWKYTSAMVQWRTFSFTYGTVEFRVKAPGGTGPWPAIWLLGKNCQDTNVMGADNQGACHWPDPGSDEIDILEILHGNRNACNQQIHSGSNNGGCVAQLPDQSLDFHTHQMIWAPGSLTWKIDGVQTCRITSGVPSTPMYLMINIAMGGFGGAVNDATLPQTMVVDYLKVTQ